MKKYLIAVLLLVVLAGVSTGVLLNSRYNGLKEEALEKLKSTTTDRVATIAGRNLSAESFAGEDQANREKVFSKFWEELQSPEIVRLKVYDKNFTVIWSNLPGLIGQRFPDHDEAEKALQGEIELEVVEVEKRAEYLTERQYGELIEVHLPFRSSAGEIPGIIEVYQPGQVIRDMVNERFQTFALLTVVAALVIVLIGAAVLHRARRPPAAASRTSGSLARKIFLPFAPIVIGLIFFLSASYVQTAQKAVFEEAYSSVFEDVQRHVPMYLSAEDFFASQGAESQSHFRELTNSLLTPSTARLTIWSRDHRVLYSDLHGVIGFHAPNHQALKKLFADPQPFYKQRERDTNEPRQTSVGEILDVYIPIQFNQQLVGAVEMQLVTHAILAPIQETNRLARYITGGVFLFVLLLVYLTFSHLIIRPLKQLQGATNAVIEGDYHTAIPLRSNDEIGMLGRDFEHMRKIVKGSMEDVREQRDLARAILNSVGEGLIVIDRDFRVVHINPSAEQLLGVKWENVVGDDYRHLFKVFKDGSEVPTDARPIAKTIQTGSSFFADIEDNYSFQTRAGRIFPVTGAVTPLMGNHVTGAVVVFRDVTDIKKLDDAKSSFISIASHQLRTPITPIRWFSEMLLQGDVGPLSKEQREIVERMYLGTNQMISTLNLLLQIARVETGRVRFEPEPLDLKGLTGEVVRSIDVFLAQKQQTVVVRVDPDPLPKLPVDKDVLWQVLLNLLTNASTYSLEHGTIKVMITLGGDHFQVAIQDHGIGIPKKQQPRIFEKFFRADNALRAAPQGNGLGLSLVKSLVEGWEGKVWFESQEGQGTTFYFSIPKAGMKPKAGEVKLSV